MNFAEYFNQMLLSGHTTSHTFQAPSVTAGLNSKRCQAIQGRTSSLPLASKHMLITASYSMLQVGRITITSHFTLRMARLEIHVHHSHYSQW